MWKEILKQCRHLEIRKKLTEAVVWYRSEIGKEEGEFQVEDDFKRKEGSWVGWRKYEKKKKKGNIRDKKKKENSEKREEKDEKY